MKKIPQLKSILHGILFFLFLFSTTILWAQNKAPIANIKGSTFLILPVTSTILYGSTSTDADGEIKSYRWDYVSGPKQYIVTGKYASTVRISALTSGFYVFKLTVTDNKGATGSSNITIKVYANKTEAYKTTTTSGTTTGGTTTSGSTGSTTTSTTSSKGCGCTKYLVPDAVGAIYTTGQLMKAVPGDVFCIKAGKYKSIRLYDFHGTAEKPIIFKNCGGKVTIAGYSAYGVAVGKSNHFKFMGNGSSEKYGISITSNLTDPYVAIGFAAGSQTTDFEVANLEVSRAAAGVWCKTQVTCDPMTWSTAFTMRNVSIHDVYVHDTKGEGFYLGHTSTTVTLNCGGNIKTVEPQKIENLNLYNCITDRTGWDGIQVAAVTKNCRVYNNKVTNFGTANAVAQQYGILFGGKCSGEVFNNYVSKGTGAGIEVFARYNVSIYNNLIVDVGNDKSYYGQDGIFIDDRSLKGTTPLTAFVSNNTIIRPKRDGVRFLNSAGNKGSSSVFYNNLVAAPGTYGKYYIYGVGPNYVKSAVDIIDKTMVYSASNNLAFRTTIDAKFVDAYAGNFQLSSNSPAVDKGKDVSKWNVKADIKNFSRPKGNAFDIGAYEYSGNTSTQSSNAVVNTFTPDNAIIADNDLENSLSLSLYPVPARDRLNIQLTNEATGKVEIRVNDMNGKSLLQKNNLLKDQTLWQNNIDVQKLVPGLYYLEALVGQRKFTGKFLIVR